MCAAVRTPEVTHLLFDRLSTPIEAQNVVARSRQRAIGEREFRARVSAWRAALSAVTPVNVALFHPDGVEFAAAMIGAWYAGKTVYLPGDVQRDTGRSLRALDVVFVGAFPQEFEPFASAPGGNADEKFAPLDANDVQTVIYTSGSTGAPQAVPKRLTQLLAEVQALENEFGAYVNDSEIVATVSHQHIYGLLFKILWPLMSQRPFVAESAVYPEQLLSLLSERKSAVVSGPAHLKRLTASLDWSAVRHNASVIFSSGGPLPHDAALAVHTLLGSAPVEVYGSSETGGIAWRRQAPDVVAPWQPLPGVTVSERDNCLAIRSPHLAHDQWFVVPDNVTFEANGHFTLLGRADRIAKIEGKRISLAGIEALLMGSDLVADACVLQLESARDELGAVIVPSKRGWALLRAENTRGLRARLDVRLDSAVERIAHPRRWRWVDALPVNTVGKTSRAALLELFTATGVKFPAVQVLDTSADQVTLELYVSPYLAAFDGHFREIPVLAGVVQVDWAVRLARTFLDVRLAFDRMEAIKFLRVYQPGDLLTVQLHWKPERRLLSFRYDSGSTAHSSGRIFFRP